MNLNKIHVIKIGGSLLNDVNQLIRCLACISKHKTNKIIIVPGGGKFSDLVRELQKTYEYDDVAAHQMAILAMKQMAILFNHVQPAFSLVESVELLKSEIQHHNILIWSPDIKDLYAANVAESWDITSDSLSAWLANQIVASELILIKSATISENSTLDDLQNQGVLDKAFCRYSFEADYKISIINKKSFNENSIT